MLKNKPEELLDEALDLDELDSAAGGAGANKDATIADGTVVAALGNGMFRVDIGGQTVEAQISGKLRMNYVSIRPDDRVRVEGNRITYRYK